MQAAERSTEPHAAPRAADRLRHRRIPRLPHGDADARDKGIAYRTVELPTGLHPLLVRACGFPGNPGPVRSIDGTHPRLLTTLDRLGTVPAVRTGHDRVQSNHDIARYLDRIQPDPPLIPADPARRAAVEEAERWGDGTLQMAAPGSLSRSALDDLSMRGADGRLGPLLARPALLRTVLSRVAGHPFRVSPQAERELLGQFPSLLDQVDAWIADGRLGGDELNVADFTIAPSLALLSYRRDLGQAIAGRPARALIDRLLPLPAAA